MHDTPSSQIAKVRSTSRQLVRELGFMSRTVAGTDLPPSAVHAIIEIGVTGRLSAKDLSEKLLLQKSTVSRLVKSLIEKGDVREARSEKDARIKYLHLTAQGEKTLAEITRYSDRQVGDAIVPLNDTSRQTIVAGLQDYAAALKACRMSGRVTEYGNQAIIREGYTPGIIGRVAEMHAIHYSGLVGFGAAFEAKVASELSEFVTRLDSPQNAIWYALRDGRVVGSIAIDGEDLEDGRAHLRWFIADSAMRGTGLGKMLIGKAMDFCDKQAFRETHLWTLKGLEVARRLYEKHGFSRAEEYKGDQWGPEIVEQKYIRPRHAPAP